MRLVLDPEEHDMKHQLDAFNLNVAPAEIECIETVDAFKYEEFTGEALPGVTLDGFAVSSAAGQLRIRYMAAMLANENTVSSTWAEFGVAQGRSAYFLSKYLPENGKFYLFDSFQGLPEAWEYSSQRVVPKGTFACDVPDNWLTDPRLEFVKGWFEDTLPMPEDTGPLGFIHIDSDIYSAAQTIFERCDNQIVPGTIILFDELWGYPNWAEHEYKALKEWGRKFRYIARDTESRVIIECV
jgi:predicted O-methyltransferase YrrM